MLAYMDILRSIGLFKGIGESELAALLSCLGAETRDAKRGELLLLAGDRPTHVGIVLAGRLHIIREDYEGNSALIAAIEPRGVFAEALCCAGVGESPVTVAADTDATVMLLPFARILNGCSNACAFHTRLIGNMMGLLADKNLMLQGRMDILSQKTVRAKVLRYLASLAPKPGASIRIPFNREALADHLCVERSALSHELSRMKRDGLIDYRKNVFTVL